MEFCSSCQEIKPYRVEEFCISKLYKVCRDCGCPMGSIDTEGLNKLLNELNFYKEKFYNEELDKCKKSQE
jgi:hypothetical protein